MSEPTRKDKLLKEEDIVDVLSKFLMNRLEGVHTSIPGQIESYEAATRKAKVKLLIQAVRDNGDILEVPIIDNVPVMFPAASSFTLTYPLMTGDKGLIVFAETGIGNYLVSSGLEVEADSPAKFQLTDAIFIPGIYPFPLVLPGTSYIDIDETGAISIFSQVGAALESLVLGDTLKGLLEQILDGIVVMTIPSPLGPLGPPANSATFTAIKAQLTTMLSQGIKIN